MSADFSVKKSSEICQPFAPSKEWQKFQHFWPSTQFQRRKKTLMAVPGDLEGVSVGINKPIHVEITLENITKKTEDKRLGSHWMNEKNASPLEGWGPKPTSKSLAAGVEVKFTVICCPILLDKAVYFLKTWWKKNNSTCFHHLIGFNAALRLQAKHWT